MPTTDIIGYLWNKRQTFDVQTLSEAVMLAADLIESGLDCIQAEDLIVLGQKVGVTTSYPRKTEEEWDDLVHAAILDASVEDTIHMMSAREEDAE